MPASGPRAVTGHPCEYSVVRVGTASLERCGQSGGSGGDLRRQAPVRQGQPLGQLTRRFIGRFPVEGHHRGRDTWGATQLGTPPVADRRDLYLVRTAANGFFEMMNRHVVLNVRIAVGERGNLTLPTVTIKRSAARRRTNLVRGGGNQPNDRREKFVVSGCPQVLNPSSTGFQQRADTPGLTASAAPGSWPGGTILTHSTWV